MNKNIDSTSGPIMKTIYENTTIGPKININIQNENTPTK